MNGKLVFSVVRFFFMLLLVAMLVSSVSAEITFVNK